MVTMTFRGQNSLNDPVIGYLPDPGPSNTNDFVSMVPVKALEK